MFERYLISFAIAGAIFALIVIYSMIKQRREDEVVDKKTSYVDPLFQELEEQKSSVKVQQTSVAEASVEQQVNDVEEAVEALSEESPKPSSSKHEQAALPLEESKPQLANTAPQKKVVDKSQSKKAEPTISAATKAADKTTSKQTVSNTKIQAKRVEPVLHDKSNFKVSTDQGLVTELVARVKNTTPIEQKELLVLFRTHDYKFHRKVQIYGLNELTDMWRNIEFELPSARFVELGVAIQLADRDGAMSQKELHDFQQMALEFSNKFDAPFEFSMEIDQALVQSQKLDKIAQRYNSMAVLNVVPRSRNGFKMADIEGCARDLRMTVDSNGIFIKTHGQKQNLTVLYRLACADGSGHFGVSSGSMMPVMDLVIYMNVPATPNPDRVFQDMVKDANNLATWLDGKVVDKNGKVITQRTYSVLMQQISDIAYSMEQEGISPGDEISKKLF